MKSQFKLYEIGALLQEAIDAAEAAVDIETGELPLDWANFLDTVQGERDQKALDIACYLKALKSESDAICSEADKLRHRAQMVANKHERIRQWLAAWLKPGEKLHDNRAVISWRKSQSVQITDESALPDAAWVTKREVSKSQIKEIIEQAGQCPGAEIVEKQSIQLK